MNRVLVLYGTYDGHTARIARVVGEEARDAGWEAEVRSCKRMPSDFSLQPYDAAVVAAPIRAGRYPGYVRRFVQRHCTALTAMPSVFISVSWSGSEQPWAKRPEAVAGYNAVFFRETGWRPAATIIVGGAIRYSRHNPLMRWLWRELGVKRAGGPTDMSRDYDFTDWPALRSQVQHFLYSTSGGMRPLRTA